MAPQVEEPASIPAIPVSMKFLNMTNIQKKILKHGGNIKLMVLCNNEPS